MPHGMETETPYRLNSRMVRRRSQTKRSRCLISGLQWTRIHYYILRKVCKVAQQKKDYIALHIKMDASLMHRLEEYCDEVGQTKTMAVERIVGAFLDERDEKKQDEEKK